MRGFRKGTGKVVWGFRGDGNLDVSGKEQLGDVLGNGVGGKRAGKGKGPV